jgi:hypothetical protein
MFLIAFGAFLGALLSLLASISIEYQRKPKLTLEIEEPPTDKIFESAPAKNARFVRVLLHNKPMPKLFRWLDRSAAMQCNGEIQFHYSSDGTPIFIKAMPIRWATSDEPFSPQVLSNGRIALVFDPSKYNAAFRRDCFPGNKEPIDIAARFDEESECYGWSNETYLPEKGWRNKDWKLPVGRYLVTVQVHSSGETVCDVFKLENSSSRENFRLLPATKEDIGKLKINTKM